MSARYRCEPLGKAHARAAFSCGNDDLDRYLHERAGQDQKRGVARPFVFVGQASGLIAGYYTLSAASVDLSALPQEIATKMPRYPSVPAILIGRLARDLRCRGDGVGELLLMNALRRCYRLSEELGAVGVTVDAIDDAARAFYERYQFSRFPEQDYKLILPMATVAAITLAAGTDTPPAR